MAGGNPDDRPRPHLKREEDEDKDTISSRHKSGVITRGEFEGRVMRRLRAKLGNRRASVIEAVVHPSIEESGTQRGMRANELDETMAALTEDHHKLLAASFVVLLSFLPKLLGDAKAILEKEF